MVALDAATTRPEVGNMDRKETDAGAAGLPARDEALALLREYTRKPGLIRS